MSSPTTIALLICDTPIGDVVSQHGDYHTIFTDLLQHSLPQGAAFRLDPYEVRQLEYPKNIEEYDAVLITGSAHSAYDNKEWISKLVSYTADVAEKHPKVKIIGICFGHQIVARALGGECVPNGGIWEVGPTPIQLTELGRKVFELDTLNIQQMHRDHVPQVPPGLHLLGSSPVCMNQGMVKFRTPNQPPNFTHEDIHVFTVQGHPEFTESITSAIVKVRKAAGVLSEEVASDAVRRKDDRNDGVFIGTVLWKILRLDEEGL